MGALIEQYLSVSKHVHDLHGKISGAEAEIARLTGGFAGDTSVRIAKLEEQLVKIDEYLLKVKGFQELAKRRLDSQNVLTIEAPPGYRVNLNRLRNWAMMIDPTATNDPYAQRVYAVAKCDEYFLESKKREFQDRIRQLRESQENGTNEEIRTLRASISLWEQELQGYILGAEVKEFAEAVRQENLRYWSKAAPAAFPGKTAMDPVLAPGAYAAPFPAGQRQDYLKGILGEFYEEKGGRVLLPVELENTKEYILSVSCVPGKRKSLDRALQNLMLASIHGAPAGERRIQVLDAVRFNSASISGLRELEETFALEKMPRNPEQLTAALEKIVSSFADTDELLELHDSVSEYNLTAAEGTRIPLSTLIVFGWPHAYEGRDRELMQRILTNYERYGVSLVLVSYRSGEKAPRENEERMPEYALQNMLRVNMKSTGTTLTLPGGEPQAFTWYTFSDTLSPEYVASLKAVAPAVTTVGNEYTLRYSVTELPAYGRDYKPIELPFGIDGKDQAHTISFENENFAAYLVGASRSGKSTLIHTLIAGIIRNYHPDNVELWLADFKQLEFKRYINHLPPHVKYVLLDESTELVFDLIDKLTAEMMQRQKLFARLGKQRIDQIDPATLDKPLPVIFVILDEFSIMSQSISESPIYKLRLQNILAKGAALGIRFLFASQTFTTGVAGLTSTARAQIQQRIAMKGTREEISETLELSANLKTEQVRNWMEALPPHYAMVKFRTSADTPPQVKRFLAMYFEDYDRRDEMIERIRSSLRAVDTYCPGDIHTYVDKKPVLVDGNSYDAFDTQRLLAFADAARAAAGADWSGEEMLLTMGTPRLMERVKALTLSAETRENILLIARHAEQACAASLMLSGIRSYLAQGGRVEVWAYGKNRLYRTYKHLFALPGVKLVEDMEAVCGAIAELKTRIREKRSDNTLIVLVGVDRICMDFDYVDGKTETGAAPSVAEVRQGFVDRGATVTTDAEAARTQYAQAWMARRRQLQEAAKAEGKTREEIKAYLLACEREFRAEYEAVHGSVPPATAAAPQAQKPEVKQEEAESGTYNAREDFVYVLKQGSRLGYHFFMYLSNLADLKPCGLKPEFFRHKMAFRLSVEDSRTVFNSKAASLLPEHICQYDDTLEHYSFRPYLHPGIGWEGWYVDAQGKVVSPYENAE